MRKWGVVLAVLGLLMLSGAALLRFVVVPGGKALPTDTDEKIEYAGTLTAVDPASIQGGDVAGGATEIPVRVDRRLTVLEAEGDAARVSDSQVVTAPSTGETVSEAEYFYTVDRRTLHAVPNFTDQPVEDAEGLVVGFPIGAEKVNYVGWVQDVGQTAHVMYQGEAEVEGLPVYEYGGEFSTEVPADQVPGGAPASLPKEQLVGLVETLDLSPELREQLTAALPLLPDEIPLTYTYSTVDSYAVEPTTGIIADLTKTTSTSVGVEGFADVELPVVELTVGYTPDNVANEVQRARDSLDQLALYGTTIPLALLGLGVVSLVVAVPLVMRRRRPDPTPTEPPAERSPTLTG
jgi:hypothetical protein